MLLNIVHLMFKESKNCLVNKIVSVVCPVHLAIELNRR